MELSTGTVGLVKMVGGWCLAFGLAIACAMHFDVFREAFGLKLSAEDLGFSSAEATPPKKAEPEVIIRYVERPAEKKEEQAKEQQRPRRSSFATSVELERQSDGHFHAEAYVNGRPVHVLVDTGATLVAMSYEDAQAAGITVGPDEFRYVSQTANGQARFAAVTLDDVRIGDVTVRNVRASVSEPGRLSKTLLGMSFLGQLRMEMKGALLVLEQ